MAFDAIKLKELGKLRVGHPFRGKIEFFDTIGTPIVTISCLSPGASLSLNNQNLRKTLIQGSRKPDFLHKNDILFAGRGLKTHASVIKSVTGEVIASPHIMILSPNIKGVDSEYLAWYISFSKTAQTYFAQNIRGTAIQHITKAALEELPVKLPELPKQKAIIKYHRAWELEQKILNEVKERRQRIVNNYLEKALNSTGA